MLRTPPTDAELSLLIGTERLGAFRTLRGTIEDLYDADSIWNPGIGLWEYELKYRWRGRTLCAFLMAQDVLTLRIILGGDERQRFEKRRSRFSPEVQRLFDDTEIYQNGKWLDLDIRDMSLQEDILLLLVIKRRPNKPPGTETAPAVPRRNGNAILIKMIADEITKETRDLMSENDITIAQQRFMEYLFDRGRVELKRAERYFGAAQPTISSMAGRLEKKGLVLLRESPLSRRAKTAELTEKGISACRNAKNGLEQIETRLNSVLDEEEREELHRLLQKIGGDLLSEL